MGSNVIKIHILGDGGVGKSAVTMSLIRSRFTEEYDPTIGMHILHPHAIALWLIERIQRIHIPPREQSMVEHLRWK